MWSKEVWGLGGWVKYRMLSYIQISNKNKCFFGMSKGYIYTIRLLVVNAKCKFEWASFIFICQIWSLNLGSVSV